MTRSRFAIVFASTAVVAALAGGVAGMVVGQSDHAAPTAPVSQVGAVQNEKVAPPNAVGHAGTATGITAVGRPVNPVAATASTPGGAATGTVVKPAAPSKPKAPKVTEPEHTATNDQQAAPVQAVEVDPTPDVPYATDGTPTSMNGTPDPQVPAVSEPEATPAPLHK